MNILVVGAGAVGQIYGYHLQRGGARVSFLVKPKHAEECRRGFNLYPLNRRDPRARPVRFEGAGVLTGLDEVRGRRWDVALLCMSSTGLQSSPEWFPEFSKALGEECTLVTLQPGLDDRDYILRPFPERRLVSGMISLISYHAPLEGERVPEPGMAYWFPPLAPSPFSGPGERPREIARALRAGGMPAAVHRDVAREAAFPGAALMVLLTALEAESWSFEALARGPKLGLAERGAREAFEVVGARIGARAPLPVRLLLPLAGKLLLRCAPRLVPLDLEAYFKAHFTKVGDQTRFVVGRYIEEGKARGLSTRALEELAGALT